MDILNRCGMQEYIKQEISYTLSDLQLPIWIGSRRSMTAMAMRREILGEFGVRVKTLPGEKAIIARWNGEALYQVNRKGVLNSVVQVSRKTEHR